MRGGDGERRWIMRWWWWWWLIVRRWWLIVRWWWLIFSHVPYSISRERWDDGERWDQLSHLFLFFSLKNIHKYICLIIYHLIIHHLSSHQPSHHLPSQPSHLSSHLIDLSQDEEINWWDDDDGRLWDGWSSDEMVVDGEREWHDMISDVWPWKDEITYMRW